VQRRGKKVKGSKGGGKKKKILSLHSPSLVLLGEEKGEGRKVSNSSTWPISIMHRSREKKGRDLLEKKRNRSRCICVHLSEKEERTSEALVLMEGGEKMGKGLVTREGGEDDVPALSRGRGY